MADNNQAYENAMAAAEMTIDPIEISGVTAENFADKIADSSLETVYDVNGNPIGYYKDTIMSVTEPGKFSTSQKVQVFMVPEYNAEKSTPDNIVVDMKVIPRGSQNTLPGGQTIYIKSDDMLKNTMKAAGYNISDDLPPELINQLWEEYYGDDENDGNIINAIGSGLISTATGMPIDEETIDALNIGTNDIALMWMKLAEFTNIKHPWLGAEDNQIAKLLKAAAAVGLTDVGEIMEDDPATKALFRGLNAGDTVNLTPVGNRDGSVFDDNWLESFIKPMTIALNVNPLRAFPSTEQWENDFLAWSAMTTLIPEQLDNDVYNSVHKHINIWCTRYGTNLWTGNADSVRMWGTYIDPSLDWYIDSNYPETRGYAILHPTGTYYKPLEYGRSYQNQGAFAGGGSSQLVGQPQFMLVYDQERFYEYLADIGQNDASSLVNNISVIFSNGTITQKNPYSEKTRDDALKITVNSSIADIIVQMEQDPVWPDNKITVPEYDPVTNTTINHNYYPVTPSVEDPRQVNWPDIQIPDIINPINDILKYPTIPSVSLPIQNDPVTPTAGSNRFWTIYNPSDGQMQALGAELWDQNVIQILKQTFVNPTDGIITWQQVFLPVSQAYQDYIYLGDYKTGVDHVPVITQQKVFKEFGIIDIPRYFNDYRDYTETEVSMYLPFIGYVDIDPRDAIGCKLTLRYSMDVITGTCVATISPKVGDNAECCYMFTGNCAVQLPITAADRSRMLSGLISGASNGFSAGGKVGGLFGGGAGAGVGASVGAVLGGALGAVSGYFGGVQKSNGFSANAGALTIYKTPFVIIHRSIPADPLLFDSYYGNPASVTATLKNLHGFTRVRECYIDIPTATDTEKQMIESYLKTGVILP